MRPFSFGRRGADIDVEPVVVGKGCVIGVEFCFIAVFAWFYHSCFKERRIMNEITAIILAAGMGTRMKSDLVKVLHPVAGVRRRSPVDRIRYHC